MQLRRVHQHHKLVAGGGHFPFQCCADMGGDGGDVSRVVQGGRPGGRAQAGLVDQGLGLAPVVERTMASAISSR
ncbi:hypothetical protein [Streptomyces sp. NPDC059970]|uniref:hypothetical protein n=1 Tax=Streptomyces sp. NPDC059970 TaxID=3347019 RepID=UPI0036766413